MGQGSRGKPTPETILWAIERDRTSGAKELSEKAVQAVLSFAKASRDLPPERLQEALITFTRRLLQAQPSMAPLLNLANTLWLRVERVKAEDLPKALEEEARRFLAGIKRGAQIAAEAGAGLAKEAGTVLTYSYSSTVLKALLLAKRQGGAFSIICSEGRPAGEGLKLAEALAKKGLHVKLVLDTALPGLLKEANLCLVGADAVLASGLINKVGTYPLALAAHDQRVPFYALCDGQKFLAKPLERFFAIPEREPAKLWRRPPKRVQVINRTFEPTPLGLLTAVVCELGLLAPAEVRRELRGREVAKMLGEGLRSMLE